jgi:hypothetical protein
MKKLTNSAKVEKACLQLDKKIASMRQDINIKERKVTNMNMLGIKLESSKTPNLCDFVAAIFISGYNLGCTDEKKRRVK